MSNFTSRIIQIILWVLMAITIVFAIIFYFGNVKEGTAGTKLEEPLITNTFLSYAFILFFITIGLTLIFAIINVIINPKGIKKGILSIVLAAVIIIVAYLMADDTVLRMPHYTGGGNVPKTLKIVDTGLITAFFLLVFAFLSILWSSVSRIFK